MEILATSENTHNDAGTSGNIVVKLGRNALLKLLNRSQGISDRRSVVPILSNIMITTKAGTLHTTATNMTVSIRDSVEASVEQEGSALVNAGLFYEIAKRLPENSTISIIQEESKLVITAGRSIFELPSLPSDDFPVNEDGDYETSFTIPANTLTSLFEKTQFAASADETRYALSGVSMQINDGVIVTAATDSHRLACADFISSTKTDDINIIIPRKTVMEIIKILKEESGQVEVFISKNKIKFCASKIAMVSKLIEGVFPNYKRVIPDPTMASQSVILNTSLLKNAVERVSLISSEKTRGVKMTLGNDLLTLSAAHNDTGSASESIDVSHKGKEIVVGFNAKYVLDVLNNIASESVTILFTETTGPVRFIDETCSHIVYVIMPMRI